jgi:hypothetical protein
MLICWDKVNIFSFNRYMVDFHVAETYSHEIRRVDGKMLERMWFSIVYLDLILFN